MRVRFRFVKVGKVRFVSHRDLARCWERALRRARLPIAYTEGFSPRPKVHFGLALSVGHESLAEYLDVDLQVDPGSGGPAIDGVQAEIEDLPARLSPALPEGVDITGAVVVPHIGAVSLQQAVTCCTWQIDMGSQSSISQLDEAINRALEAPELIVTRTRKGKDVTEDIRPLVRSLEITDARNDGVVITADLGTQPRSLRPSELISALGPSLRERRVMRLHQWIESDGERREPIPAPPSMARTEVCAS
ncbi:MAG: TIGR03936 family radical SAM-associated protein [Actinomycetota bacterium]|nr:TIGR03936 family radical SAM-associated protein [Actinomycetota bacterium]